MATINLGRVKPVFRGAYAGGTAYVVDDIVTSGNETFICIQASTGNATSNASYWTKLAAKGTDGTDLTSTLTTQGDIVYRDGSGLARLGYGTNGQLLKTGGSGANPSWTDAPSGSVPVVETFNNTPAFFSTSTAYTYVDVTALDTTITPSSASSKILLMVALDCAVDTFHYMSHFKLQRKIGSGSFGYNVTNGYGSGDDTASSRSSRSEDDSNGSNTMIGNFVDVPNTTDAVTYRIQVSGSSGSGTLYLNRNSSNNSNSGNWQRAYGCKVIAIELKQ